jgi:hypothetical protein
MASNGYTQGLADFLDGTSDWDAGGQTYNVLLASTSYTPDKDHQFVSSVTNELSGGGYVRKTTANRAATRDTTNDRVDLKADNITWTALTGAPRYAIVFKQVTNDADSRLIACIDLTAQSLAGVDFTIKWDGQASNGTIIRYPTP